MLLALALPGFNALITLILILLVVGVAIYLVRAYAPVDGPIKSVIVFIIALVGLLYFLKTFGVM